MASSSSSSSNPPRPNEVFISFRGADTRNNFVSHLHSALKNRGILTFLDSEDLHIGQSLPTTLPKAIQESRVAIIVFSKNYADSSWCLHELMKIMECKHNFGMIIMPVFYDVEPTDVRKQTGEFGIPFAKYEECQVEEVPKWKKALREIANVTGESIHGRVESKCIDDIIDEVFKYLPKISPLTKHLVGIRSYVDEIKSALNQKLDRVCFYGIYGMGGVGKTTLARVVFDELQGAFEGSCFLQDVRHKEVTTLQSDILSDVLQKDFKVSNEIDGASMISQRLSNKRVLLVLDDISDAEQLELLANEREWFGAGSRVIITSRDSRCLQQLESDETFKVKVLPSRESMQLFSHHAFKEKRPPSDLEILTKLVVSYADGLPLALKILGSYLKGRQIRYWKDAVNMLKEHVLGSKIFPVLRVSYEGLKSYEKQLFLDIACFFRGYEENSMRKKIMAFRSYTEIGIETLLERSLIHIEQRIWIYQVKKGTQIIMHDLVQEMGWNIVREEVAKQDIRKYSRLWTTRDICKALSLDNKETIDVEGLVLDVNGLNSVTDRVELIRQMIIKAEVFRNMNKLMFLDIFIDKYNYPQDGLQWLSWLHCLPKGLKWFSCNNIRAPSFPSCFTDLVCLKMSGSSIKRTPDFSCMPMLEEVDLSHSRDLVEIDPSIGTHNKIKIADFSMCSSLKMFPIIAEMESLEFLELSNTSLERFPEVKGNVDCLQALKMMNIRGLQGVPWLIGRATSLQSVQLGRFETQPNLERKRDLNIEYEDNKTLSILLTLPNLRRIRMKNFCISEIIIDEVIGSSSPLQELILSGNKFEVLPGSIIKFCYLTNLYLDNCKKLKRLLALPLSLESLLLDFCTSLEYIPNLVHLSHLKRLSVEDCLKLEEVVDLPSKLEILILNGCRSMKKIPKLVNLSSLTYLSFNNCSVLKEVQQLPPNLVELQVDFSSALEAIIDLPSTLQKLSLMKCTSLSRLPSLVDLLDTYEDLHILALNSCYQLSPSQDSMPVFLKTFWQWDSVHKMLLKRKRIFEVVIPGGETPKWFNHCYNGSHVTVTLPQYSPRVIKGFIVGVRCADTFGRMSVRTAYHDPEINFDEGDRERREHTGFAYVPMRRGQVWEELKNSLVFDVQVQTYYIDEDSKIVEWAFRVVYDCEANETDEKDFVPLVTFPDSSVESRLFSLGSFTVKIGDV